MRSGKFILVFAFIFLTVKLYSQTTAAEIRNITASMDSNNIYVNYDIVKSSAKEKYKTVLLFKTSSGKWITPKTVQGDVNDYIKGGENKTIIWDVFEDTVEFVGDLTPYIRIVDFTEKLGGPFNAFYSLLIPGTGDYKVRKNEDIRKGFYKPFFTSIIAYGIAGYGVFQKIQSDKYYKDYLASMSQSEINRLYSKSNNSNKQFLLAISTAALIWCADITYVIYKGIKNKKGIKSKKNLNKSAYQTSGLYLNYDRLGLQAGYYYRF